MTFDSSKIRVIDISSMTVPELISEIEKNPKNWLGEKDIKYLNVFLNGYFHGKNFSDDSNMIYEFGRFIEDRFNVRTTEGWAKIIESNSENGQLAIDNFFNFFREFLQCQEKT